ncbi:uncharacterized protein K460DRAFT_398304 [Cucurbitaria berberidis CBS 394.84]|uniref:Uncharacterized protein n=1 Tax=Cucurbitaria berberidis CBS 394.84 TaxID=1168544 RepID=A0A9P4GB43_9PLEO|nr:uncharacterized protein K460DRAFT_398304 [Cucurbitaria berberidis CBS 394.84]KAF1842279.1 hypothetical protein K460DRAFT_398304 [Cucurbitaria berberidis CBS 394.84]
MSESALSQSASTPMDAADNHDVCDEPATSESPPKKPKLKKKKKKRYVPPRPDSDTFSTQQDFLDSLVPIAIEEVAENARKCPICWKIYGEAADPGFDNTEQPVKLRCNHTFGDKCLATTFGTVDASKAALRPLSFTPTSRGTALGLKLRAFVELHSKNSTGDVNTFVRMLEESYKPGKGGELFGEYWFPVIQELQHTGRRINDVTFLENATVLDTKVKSKSESVSTLLWTLDTEAYDAHNVPKTFSQPTLSSSSSSNGPLSSKAAQASAFSSMATELPSTFPPMAVPSLSQLQESTQSVLQISEQILAAAGQGATWGDFLAVETKLDKLMALNKQAKPSIETPLAAQKEQALVDQVAIDEAKSRQKRMQDDMVRIKRDLTNLLAQKLAGIFTAFSKQQNSSLKCKEAPIHRTATVKVSVVVHTQDIVKTSYKIAPPLTSILFYDKNSQDTVDTEKFTWIVIRSTCQKCCKIKEEDAKDLPTPEELWWSNDAKTPDDCPLCHKILFKKTNLEE